MSPVDIIFIIILLWGAFRGWKDGLIKEVFSSCGVVVGLIVAIMFYKTLGEQFCPALGSGSMASYLSCVLAFILIWVVVPIIFGMVANVLTRAVKVMCLGPLNKALGLVLGTLKFFVFISFVFSAMSYVGVISQERKQKSVFYPYVTVLGNLVLGDEPLAQDKIEEDEESKTVIIRFDRDKEKEDNDAAE